MGKVKNLLEEMKNNMPQDLNKDEKIRYVYLYLGKKFKKDVNFFYGAKKRRSIIYNKDVDIKSKNSFSVICKSIAQIYLEAFKMVGIESELIQMNYSKLSVEKDSSESPIKHVDLAVKGENDLLYHLNPMYDLFKISDKKLKKIDDKLGYTWHGMYTDEFFDTLREETINRSLLKTHIKEVFPNIDPRMITRDFCTQYKLEFILQHLNFSNSFSRLYRI